MPRDQNQKHFALMKLLRDNGLSASTVHTSASEDATRQLAMTRGFSEGWTEAQKWEVTEAQRMGIAVQAMVGALSNETSDENAFKDCDKRAEFCFKMADAMIAQAQQPHGLRLASKLREIKNVLKIDALAYDYATTAALIEAIIDEDQEKIDRLMA